MIELAKSNLFTPWTDPDSGVTSYILTHKVAPVQEAFYFVNESISGTTFRGRLIEETKVGDYPAVIPEVTGSAYITGFNHIFLDPDDPLGAEGFLLGQQL